MDKILIVDDDESVLELLKESIKLIGYDVTALGSATEAVGKMKSEEGGFPVILTDIMMPGINGLELLHRIKKEYPETIVIMLTAYTTLESAVKSLNEGAFAYLTKPINYDELKNALQNAFEKHHQLQEKKKLIEELSKAKEYSDTLVHHLVHTVIATDSNGYIKKVNLAMEKLLGYTEEEIIGLPIQFIFGKEFQETTLEQMIKKGSVKDFPVTFVNKDKQELKLLFTGTVMKNKAGYLVGFIGTAKNHE
ncbi:MAG: response regulator [Elusimicrobia bacterium]|nr:response regulator [Candidatus Liberimonas magnetica]